MTNRLKQFFYFFILFLLTFSCYATSINHTKIQQLLDQLRIKNHAPGAVLTIDLPENKVVNFVSGTAKIKTIDDPYPPLLTTDHLFAGILECVCLVT